MQLHAKAAALFQEKFGGEPTTCARAPGRIEFIGNHTDYNCGTVIGASIDRGIAVAARLRHDGKFVFADHSRPSVEVARPFVPHKGGDSWVNYPLGVITALYARGMSAVPGLELAVISDVPPGAGLSSSAAFELATALAACALMDLEIDKLEMVMACREAENRFVGVPCGILDQGVSGFGEKDRLVHIDCRGPEMSTLPLPAGVRFWIFNTHKKHELVDSLYATRHGECMEAARLLAKRHAGVTCLADVTPVQVAAAADLLPDKVFKRARHVVEEIARVDEMGRVLAAGDLEAAGRLLFASHESSRTLFENSTLELDFLVDALRGRPGVLGARLTGGGFGGAAMAMTRDGFGEAEAASVADAYAARFGDRPDVITCATADGARLVTA